MWWLDPTGRGRICTCRPPELAPRNEKITDSEMVERLYIHWEKMFVDFPPVEYLIVLKRGGVGTQGYGAQGQGVLPADQDGAALGTVQRTHTCSYMVRYGIWSHIHIYFNQCADPWSECFPSRIPDLIFFHPGPKELVSKLSEIWFRGNHPGYGSCFFTHPGSRIQGSKKTPDSGSGSATLALIWQNIFSVLIQVPKIQTRYQLKYLYCILQ